MSISCVYFEFSSQLFLTVFSNMALVHIVEWRIFAPRWGIVIKAILN